MPAASVVVMTAPSEAAEMTTEWPDESVVVKTVTPALVDAADVINADVVTTTEPLLLVEEKTTAGTVVLAVLTWPLAFVVVTTVPTLAVAWVVERLVIVMVCPEEVVVTD